MDQQQELINALLEKYSLGICTPEEKELVEAWYNTFPQTGQLWRDANEKASMHAAMKQEIFKVISPGAALLNPPRREKRLRRIWWQAAAALVIIFLIFHTNSPKNRPVYVTVSASPGKGILKLQLPDRSRMWLEPGTTIRYREDFGHAGREIELTDGMAFFEVQKHPDYPFFVKTPGGLQTKVLGTEFTVKAYKALTEIQVMVRSGTVQVTDSAGLLGILKAGQQLTYRRINRMVTRTEGVLADWRDGDLTLSNASLAEVVRILENRYGLLVKYDASKAEAYQFTLTIGRHTTTADLLGTLKDISGLNYTLNNNHLTIY